MGIIGRVVAPLVFLMVLGVVQFIGMEARAQSSYFTSRGCSACHSAPTASTCAGCHHHSGTLSATKNKTTDYAPGEEVRVTLAASGARTGWIGARLYDQTGAEIARSTGNQSGMGGAATFPATLSAPAPAAAGTYTWRIAYFGNEDGTGSGDVHSELSVNVSFTVASATETTPPTLTVSTLANGAVTNNATLNVSGTASDASGIASVTINGTVVTVAGDGSFTTALTLVSGANIITTVATDTVGNQATDTRTINLDLAGPLLTISSPADNSKVNQSFIDVTGSVSENSTVTVNGGGAAMNGLNFSATVNLAEGINTIDISATDLLGNISTAKRTVTSDLVAPSLAVTVPAQDITSSTASNTISGTVSDALTAVTVTITADGISYTPAVANGSFTQAVTLSASNTYPVVVTATDEAGNQVSVTRNIIFTQSTMGDINGDSTTNIQDALMALQLAVGSMPMNNSYLAQGDVAPYVNGQSQPDGQIDIADALVILKMAVGLLPSVL